MELSYLESFGGRVNLKCPRGCHQQTPKEYMKQEEEIAKWKEEHGLDRLEKGTSMY